MGSRHLPAALAALACLALVGGCGTSEPTSSGTTTTSAGATGATVTLVKIDDRVKVYDVADPKHVEGTVKYPQTPPVGGDHNPVWQNCGVYRSPVTPENAVHALEHGAVWLTYTPATTAGDVSFIESLAKGQTHVLVSPERSQPAPVMATAWGHQMSLDTLDKAALTAFVAEFQEGPQTPEPGATCAGGTGDPS